MAAPFSLGSVVFLGLLTSPAQPPAEPHGSQLPLVVSRVSYSPGQCGEFELRNRGSVAVIAWHVSFMYRSADGWEHRTGLSRDNYGQVAGLKYVSTPQRVVGVDGVSRTNGLLEAGDAVLESLSCPSRPDGQPPDAVDVRVDAVFLDGNRPLGDPAMVESILDWRRRTAQSCDEVATLLRGVRAKARDDVEALRLAAKELESVPGSACRGLALSNIRLSLHRVDRNERDPARDHIEHYIRVVAQEGVAARQAAAP